jgi:hypothetical protein
MWLPALVAQVPEIVEVPVAILREGLHYAIVHENFPYRIAAPPSHSGRAPPRYRWHEDRYDDLVVCDWTLWEDVNWAAGTAPVVLDPQRQPDVVTWWPLEIGWTNLVRWLWVAWPSLLRRYRRQQPVLEPSARTEAPSKPAIDGTSSPTGASVSKTKAPPKQPSPEDDPEFIDLKSQPPKLGHYRSNEATAFTVIPLWY